METHSIPLITLRNSVLTPNRTHPAFPYGYEQPNLGAMPRAPKVAPYGTNGQVRERKDKNKSYAKINTRNEYCGSVTRAARMYSLIHKIVHTGTHPQT